MIAELPVERVAIGAKGHEAVDRLEEAIMQLPKAEITIVHHFPPGIYAREMRAPAGSAITGKIHRTQHLNIVSAGRLVVYNAVDGTTVEVRAPATFISEPGTRRAAVVMEDCVWTTVHPRADDETTPEQLETRLIEPYENPLTLNTTQPCLS